jgi:uncharacterized OB-fold protein
MADNMLETINKIQKLFPDKPAFERVFRCEMCGGNVDPDHCYCDECGDHAGEWVNIDENGEEIV